MDFQVKLCKTLKARQIHVLFLVNGPTLVLLQTKQFEKIFLCHVIKSGRFTLVFISLVCEILYPRCVNYSGPSDGGGGGGGALMKRHKTRGENGIF